MGMYDWHKAPRHWVTCVSCGRKFDANTEGFYYYKYQKRYKCPSCVKREGTAFPFSPFGGGEGGGFGCISFVLYFILFVFLVGLGMSQCDKDEKAETPKETTAPVTNRITETESEYSAEDEYELTHGIEAVYNDIWAHIGEKYSCPCFNSRQWTTDEVVYVAYSDENYYWVFKVFGMEDMDTILDSTIHIVFGTVTGISDVIAPDGNPVQGVLLEAQEVWYKRTHDDYTHNAKKK